ncbi:MAG: type II toxin-antitoxin system Phd/YefM family antitoxin [Deltaproteobacteria bacterium]|nr:type II toxin-antitoxin system Phd/YefM family antitoxin [Deltaproteobacteria bacterium]
MTFVKVNIYQAKTRFSSLIARVKKGETIIIAEAGRPVAQLTALPTLGERKWGRDKGRVKIAKDFDETPDEMP